MKKSIVLESPKSGFLFTSTSWNRFKQPYNKNSEYEQNNLLHNCKNPSVLRVRLNIQKRETYWTPDIK